MSISKQVWTIQRQCSVSAKFLCEADKMPQLVNDIAAEVAEPDVWQIKSLIKAITMKLLPEIDKTPLIRTDFSDEAAWEKVCSAAGTPDSALQEGLGIFISLNNAMGQSMGEPETPLQIVDDLDYKDLAFDKLLELLPRSCNYGLIFVADRVTISDANHPVLVVDVHTEPGRNFRSVPSQIFCIESNLSIANMDWEDFEHSVDQDGVFRGFCQ